MKSLFVLAMLVTSTALAADLEFKSNAAEILKIEAPCVESKLGCFISINDDHGQTLVRISERTGKVTVIHPERQDEASRQFWRAMERAFGHLHCGGGK